MILDHPLIPQKQIPIVIYNETSENFGSGITAIAPGHDLDSLRIALVSSTKLIIFSNMICLRKEWLIAKD